jgi:hypothetical protein
MNIVFFIRLRLLKNLNEVAKLCMQIFTSSWRAARKIPATLKERNLQRGECALRIQLTAAAKAHNCMLRANTLGQKSNCSARMQTPK